MHKCLSWKCFAARGRNFNALLGALVALQAVVLPENAHYSAISGLFKKISGLKYLCLLPLPGDQSQIIAATDRKKSLAAYECVTRVASTKLGWPAAHTARANTLMACAVCCARAEPDIATFQHKLAQAK